MIKNFEAQTFATWTHYFSKGCFFLWTSMHNRSFSGSLCTSLFKSTTQCQCLLAMMYKKFPTCTRL